MNINDQKPTVHQNGNMFKKSVMPELSFDK